ncbi:ATP-binding protein [Streptomyces sp. CC219B]|uniref:ATP-binding protein n=1 Tax=Streptomyces sp. CC219B TaxID=3044574 RepID=UPI0024A8E835|nr:ATP-binding protein [Streptomyces sp. CC219B]
MATEPRWKDSPPSETDAHHVSRFTGALADVTGARLAAEDFLRGLARDAPPSSPDHLDDVLLVVAELAANAVQYAPGPFELRMGRTSDGVHVVMCDSSTTLPTPRRFRPHNGGGGIGWYLIEVLGEQVSVVPHEHGKDIHVFLPW